MADRVVVTGAASVLGSGVVAAIADDPDVHHVVAVEGAAGDPLRRPKLPAGALVDWVPGVPTPAEWQGLLRDADVLVLLGTAVPAAESIDGSGLASGDLDACRWVLDAAAAAGVRHVVVRSTAMVYGAWPDNPVPLTEDAPVRPGPASAFALEHAELERLVLEWRGRSGATVALLRTAVVVHPDDGGWLRRSAWSAGGLPVEDGESPRQFVHVDDVVAAVDVARRRRLDGVFNVAPDGWTTAEQVRRLRGPAPRLPLRPRFAARLRSWRGRLPGGTPEGLLAYLTHPWVVANDRLEAAGWTPSHTGEEAYVVADTGGALASLSARRRQQLSLVGVGVAGVAVVGAAYLVVRRLRR
ncbi:MAG: NAD-dependent epimerase/dehydratase family protein [Acidimicrobiales bacterium]|jgi:nucleoside-diphosphate-sugar epimerase|nr:NAD-dependent epimerase/dehydratase family protein [Acidimicrobiales bacterium]